jgi:hypothetical protein
MRWLRALLRQRLECRLKRQMLRLVLAVKQRHYALPASGLLQTA